tara:strand:- start:4306 stop:4860 length:555 start_codon:yes stop_codon:yes gene_type:complete
MNNNNYKRKFEKFLLYLFCLFSTLPLFLFVRDKLIITNHKLVLNRNFAYENPKNIDINEMEILFNELSYNHVILNSGFVVANDFLTYSRSKNYLDKKSKRIFFENISKNKTLINNWDKSQKISFLLSCRYSNCKRDKIELKGIFVNFKESKSIISKKQDLICYPNIKINENLGNFGLYDCFFKK